MSLLNEFRQLSIKELQFFNDKKNTSKEYNIAMGEKSLKLSKWSDALQYANQALQIDSKSEEAFRIIATVQELNGDFEGAALILEKIKQISDSVGIYIDLCKLLMKHKDYIGALKQVNDGVPKFNSEELLYLKCIILEKLRRFDECIKSFNELIMLSNEKSIYLYDYAILLRSLGKQSEAKEVFKKLNNYMDTLPEEYHFNVQRFLSEEITSNQNFKAAARILTQLGEQMIENENVALSELIKNAYDARSSFVGIYVDTNYEERGEIIGKVVIKDAGYGMTKEIIKDYWLTISTNVKLKQKNDKTIKNIPLGEKGIGRLSADRLGRKLVVETSVEGEDKKTYLEVDWEKFETSPELALEDINVILSQVPENPASHYTTLIITKLRNPDFWNQLISNSKQKMSLKKALFSMISPFEGLQDAFRIEIIINGTKLDMDIIDEDFLEIISTVKLEFNFAFNDKRKEWEANISTILFPDFYLQKTKKNITLLSSYEDNKWLNAYIDAIKLPDSPQSFPKTLYQEDLMKKLADTWEVKVFGFKSPGPFKMKVYSFSRGDQDTKDIVSQKLANIFGMNANKQIATKNYFDSIMGVKIYRDGFRIFPYGEASNDWLGLNISATSTGKYDDLKSNNTTGYVALTGKNTDLREKTNREGFISDVYSSVFFRLCSLAIDYANECIQDNLSTIRNSYKKINDEIIKETEKIKKEQEDELKKMKEQLQGATQGPSDSTKVATTALKYSNRADEHVKTTKEQSIALKEQYEQLMMDVERVTELASLGMLVEAFTHEFELQSNKLKKVVDNVKKSYTGNLDIQRQLLKMESIIGTVDGYMAYLAPSYQKERKSRVRLDLITLLNSMYSGNTNSFMATRASRYDIRINIIGKEPFVVLANQGLLTQIFDNLYLNSEYWLNLDKEQEIISVKEFNIEFNYDLNQVIVWDTGQGVDPSIEAELFEAFKTKKEDGVGRGLGLYITKNISEMLKIKIYLSQERNRFDRRYKFVLDFSKNGGL